jgi:hypothetical protein
MARKVQGNRQIAKPGTITCKSFQCGKRGLWLCVACTFVEVQQLHAIANWTNLSSDKSKTIGSRRRGMDSMPPIEPSTKLLHDHMGCGLLTLMTRGQPDLYNTGRKWHVKVNQKPVSFRRRLRPRSSLYAVTALRSLRMSPRYHLICRALPKDQGGCDAPQVLACLC